MSTKQILNYMHTINTKRKHEACFNVIAKTDCWDKRIKRSLSQKLAFSICL